jgi:serine/threonine protein kinase
MWNQVKRIFRAGLPGFFGGEGQARKGSPESDGGTLSETQTVDSLGSWTRLHPVSPRTAQSLCHNQVVAGRFEILRFLSSGGMGEVYEAWDRDLQERIALKTIRPEIAANPSVIERFKREVKQARVISHENVCRVYEVFSHTQPSGDRLWFLTMELLEGQTLSGRLRQLGPFQPKQALELIDQMIAGLAAAHDHGIVHRDFKSSNVMLVDRGAGKTRAVITDFGLALNISKERTSLLDNSGGGTPRYMAPEQESDGAVGLAADQYALGVVICEMLTGKVPSRASHERAADLPGRLTPRWEAVTRRCLSFRPEDRFKDVQDVLLALHPHSRSKNIWVAGAVVVLILAIGAILLVRIQTDGLWVQEVAQLTPDTDLTSRPSLSRDGQTIAYSSDRAEAGNLDIWVQHLPAGSPQRLTTNPAQDADPNISPDASSVVFRSERDGGGIYLINSSGTNERLLTSHGRNPRFSPDGRSVLYWVGDLDDTVASGKLYLVSVADGSLTPLAVDFTDARLPVWSSDGRYILFTGCRGKEPLPGCSEWWAMRSDGTAVQNTGSLALLRQQQIQPIEQVGAWKDDMVIFSGRRGTTISLWALTIPRTKLRVEGKPRQLTSGEARDVAPSIAESNKIAFEHLVGALHVWRIAGASDPKLVATTKLTHDPSFDLSPYISRDGRWLVFSRGVGSPRNIWIKDMQSGDESLFLASPQDKLSPIVDSAGKTVVFEAREADIPSVFVAARGAAPRRLCTACNKPTGWLVDDKLVLYSEGLPSKIKMCDISTRESKTVLEANGYSLGDATWSPEAGYLLFTASRAGSTKQIFAVSFPKPAQPLVGQWIPISGESEFSDRPQWSGDGKTIFYLSNRDGFSCIWGQHIDPTSAKPISAPFAVMHYHNPRFSLGVVVNRTFNLSASADSLYFNVGEINTSVWTGVLKRRSLFSSLNLQR